MRTPRAPHTAGGAPRTAPRASRTAAAAPAPALLVLPGSHLFAPAHLRPLAGTPVFMAEDLGLCTVIRHHKQKIVLFLAAMRAHRDALVRAGFDVEYHALDGPTADLSYEQRLERTIGARATREIVTFEIEDRSFDARLDALAQRLALTRRRLPSPMFLTTADQCRALLGGRRVARMADFYRDQRTRLGVLLQPDGAPVGGRWSFDTENRLRLPDLLPIPEPPGAPPAPHVADAMRLVEQHFPGHPGTLEGFAWPTTRAQALRWLDDFIDHRLALFGPYEDAISTRSDVVFHSRLSPLLNCGLLTPREVLDRVLARAADTPLPSLEGFVRQLIGWREIVRAVDLVFGARQSTGNAWDHHARLAPCWWTGDTGVPPLDDTIRSALRTGWAHHILRLMVAANIMNLAGVSPAEACRWFTELFIDSAEWVMGPNVYGMGLASDGGILATKPYICGSNYLLKMSDYARGPWCDALDGLYWGFVRRHRAVLARNPRTSTAVRALDRLEPARLARIADAGERLRARLVAPPQHAPA